MCMCIYLVVLSVSTRPFLDYSAEGGDETSPDVSKQRWGSFRFQKILKTHLGVVSNIFMSFSRNLGALTSTVVFPEMAVSSSKSAERNAVQLHYCRNGERNGYELQSLIFFSTTSAPPPLLPLKNAASSRGATLSTLCCAMLCNGSLRRLCWLSSSRGRPFGTIGTCVSGTQALEKLRSDIARAQWKRKAKETRRLGQTTSVNVNGVQRTARR